MLGTPPARFAVWYYILSSSSSFTPLLLLLLLLLLGGFSVLFLSSSSSLWGKKARETMVVVLSLSLFLLPLWAFVGFGVKNVIKMKLKTNTSLLVLYVCYWPGLLRIALQDPALLYLDLYREASLCPYRLNTASSLLLFPILERRRRRRALYNKRKERDVQRDDVNKRGVKKRTKKKM